ncbi:MAG: ribonuclease J, partial [Clostridia bacterium]|nr:ribonuclease J [Clostridia bacterium]
ENQSRRLIIATFASNVHRLQQILDIAEKYNRKIVFSGRSMTNIVDAASKIGELRVPEKLIVDIDRIKNFKDGEIVILSTGTQGEPMSALTHMASGEFNGLTVGENDTVVISASVIPGNEKMIYGVINNLYRLGAQVIYESLEPIHVSGHSCREELRTVHSLVKPKFFIPVHGEYRHLKKHADLAVTMGLKKENVLIADIGDTIEFTKDTMKRGEKFQSGSMFVDGVELNGADSFILRDRIHLSEDGVVVVVVGINEYSAELTSVEIIGKGVTLSEEQNSTLKETVASSLSRFDLKRISDNKEISGLINRSIRNYLFKSTKKNPMILPVVIRI